MKQAPKSTFSYTFKFPVWQSVISADGLTLGIEARGEGLDDVIFYQYDIQSEEIHQINLDLTDKWWLRMISLFGEYYIFHEYKGEGNPEVSRLLITGKDGEIIKEFENMIFTDALPGDNKILMTESRNEENSFLYDLEKAELKRSDKVIERSDEYATDIKYPVQYPEGTEYFKDVNDFLEIKRIKPSIGAVEYLETESFILISGYDKIGKLFSHKLFIFDEEGNLLKEILLESAGKGLTKEPYFVMNGKLFVIEDKNTISTYEV